MKSHWHDGVRKKAQTVLELLPKVDPKPPNTLPIDTWNIIREMASINYPGVVFKEIGKRLKAPKKITKK